MREKVDVIVPLRSMSRSASEARAVGSVRFVLHLSPLYSISLAQKIHSQLIEPRQRLHEQAIKCDDKQKNSSTKRTMLEFLHRPGITVTMPSGCLGGSHAESKQE
ncbi:hypothetical protein EVAR_20142_1 [Eumeta japonica]|uniref:Uncharacterized protein n=1 Tax=Eumeta variegata TaxID=151549 RepID=A0A4C1V3X1_EUMVA|nr:hypothetical protein EVAR_20142_1 [Eumeta japonica]